MLKKLASDDKSGAEYYRDMLEAQHIIVEGHVQGVGYRFFTKKRADELGLMGWVRNLLDGRVEALIQGEPSAVTQMVEQLRRGPQRGRVDKLYNNKIGLQDGVKDFQIVEGGREPCRIKEF